MFGSKLNAMDISAVLKLSREVSHECTNVRVQIKRQGENWTEKIDTNARMFGSKLNAMVADMNLKLSWEISHII